MPNSHAALTTAVLCLVFTSTSHGQVITTAAGGDWSFPSQTIPAGIAPLGAVTRVTLDAGGNVFVADPSNNIVVRISPAGMLDVVAGNGIQGYSGNGAPATSSELSNPNGLAVDAAGNLYIADSGNNRIRKVSADGTITVVAGSGQLGFSGDGGPATSARLNNPGGIAIDSSGNLYIADSDNDRIRKVTLDGFIQTVAGNGIRGYSGDNGPGTNASLNSPLGIWIDSGGTVYIADSGNNRIRTLAGGMISTLAGNGVAGYSGDAAQAVNASLCGPSGVAVDSAGNVYIADPCNNRIRGVTPGGIISTIAGNGSYSFSPDGTSTKEGGLSRPLGVSVDGSGNLYFAETNAGRVRTILADGTLSTVAGTGGYRYSGDGGLSTIATLNNPSGIGIAGGAQLFIADSLNQRVRTVGSDGTIVTAAGGGAETGEFIPATSSLLTFPSHVVIDAGGNLYISDSARSVVRKVTPDGTVTTFAGNGIQGFAGDGGPAASAALNSPLGLALDASGGLYIADSQNNRIRWVTTNGVISTVAGNGANGYSGDNMLATQTGLSRPVGVAVEASGNLLIADYQNARIRRVSNEGIISTIAGNGTPGYSGDGGPAISAQLNGPIGVTTDSSGNVYVAEEVNNRIRRFVTGGAISTVVGTGVRGSAGDGGAPAAALLSAPADLTTDKNGNLFIADAMNNRVREVLATAPFFANPAPLGTVQLAAISGGKPVSADILISCALNAQSTTVIPGVFYSAAVTSDTSWLSLSPESGSTPGLVTVTADPSTRGPGTYMASIGIATLLASPQFRVVNVQLTVTQGSGPTLAIDKDQLSFTYSTTSTPRTQTITVLNQGNGSLPFTTSIEFDSNQPGNWLRVSPASATATPTLPVALNIVADPTGLPQGTYTSSLTITGTFSGSGSVTVPITMTITGNPAILLLSKTGMTFTAVQNGGVVPPQTFGVLNLGSGAIPWSVQTSTLSGGNWLLASPAGGASDSANTGAAPLVSVSVNATGLNPGIYYGLVKVISRGAANTPQLAVAVLQVLAAGSDVAPIAQPTSLYFTAAEGQSSPGSQDVLVYDPTGTGKSFRSGKTTVDGAGWFVTLPSDATLPANQPRRVVVQPLIDGLSPGNYQGALTLQYSDGRVSRIGIAFAVSGAAVPHARRGSRDGVSTTANCQPNKLIPSLTTLGSGFNIPAGFPQGLQANIVDDCGTPLLKGTAYVEFSNGDPKLKLQSLNDGRWDGTWSVNKMQSPEVTLTVTATDASGNLTGTAMVKGGLGAAQPPPSVLPPGIVSRGTSIANRIAPGGVFTISGQLLSNGTDSANGLPLPITLDDTVVTIGDEVLPLFSVSDGEVKAAANFDLNVNTNQQLLVQRDVTYATPVYVDVAPAQPAVNMRDGQPNITDAAGNPISASNPAQPGQPIMVFCTGLGPVTSMVTDGAAAPDGATTVYPVSVTIGSQTLAADSAALATGRTNVYAVSVSLPADVDTGSQVSLSIVVGGQMSAPVLVNIQ